jgi:polygalacturonase
MSSRAKIAVSQPKNPSKWACLVMSSVLLFAAQPLRADVTVKDDPMPDVVLPTIPDKAFKITDFGAKGDGTTYCTQAIQKAIDAASAAGGGVVEVPDGKYLTAAFHLASSVNLHLDDKATILFSDKMTDYKLTNNRYENCLQGDNLHDIAVTGKGTIDGQGAIWWNGIGRRGAPAGSPHRPYMIFLNKCQRVLFKDVTLANSPMFHLVPQACQNLTIDGITISSPEDAHNTDGIDPSGWNIIIKNCTIDTGDDHIALKPVTLIEEGKPSCENILVTDCTFKHGHGMSIGGQTPGGLHNLVVRNCTFDGADAGIRLKAARGGGGEVDDLHYHDIKMTNTKIAIDISSYYPKPPKNVDQDPAQPAGDTTPNWHDIVITNVTSTDGTGAAGEILGLPELHVRNVVLTNVHLAAKKGFTILHADGVKFDNSDVKAENGKSFIITDSKVDGVPNEAAPAAAAD